MKPRILTDWEVFMPVDTWLDAQESDQCDAGPCGDDPECPCSKEKDA